MRLITMVLLVSLVPCTGMSETIQVRQDGSGDFNDISSALTAAIDGDVIVVGPGNYAEHLMPACDVTLQSELGASVTTLDGSHARRIIEIVADVDVTIIGFSLANGYAERGAAILMRSCGNLLVDRCHFSNNTMESAVLIFNRAGWAVVRNSSFVGNQASAVVVAPDSSDPASVITTIVENCYFEANSEPNHAGAIDVNHARAVTVRNCVILENSGIAGAINCYRSSGSIESNTFVANIGTMWGTVHIFGASAITFSNNIVANEQRGWGVVTDGGNTISCNVFHGNASGDISSISPSFDNIFSDPQFCALEFDDLALAATSPAIPENNNCGLIGAVALTCDGVVAVENSSWGDLKARFR